MAVAAIIIGSALGACGGDDNDGPVQGTPVPGETAPGTTGQGGPNQGADTGQKGQQDGNPPSAGDRNPNPPDNSIGDRPGGPNSGNGAQGGGSGGITPPVPPQPSPVR